MMNFCTLFDSGYIQRGLALYDSLCKTCDAFHLYIMAFDDKSYDMLTNLGLPNMTVVNLKNFEDERLLEVKPTRSRAEYCWTCGPSVIYYFITTYNLESCTYLDSDLYFYRSPQLLFKEIGEMSVAITDHYAPHEIPQGRYCVQFMYFKNDEWGIKALTWWRDRCIEWCYAHFEDGKFGDQKYLEDFPKLFKNVHVVKTRGAGIASWNLSQYVFDKKNLSFVFVNELYDIVFVHYHGLSMEVKGKTVIITPSTFDITPGSYFLFANYARIIMNVCNKYLGFSLSDYKLKERSLIKRMTSKLKLMLRDFVIVRFLYERFFRPEHKGYDKKTII